MSNLKTTDTEKVRVIDEVNEKLKERKLTKQVYLVKRQKTLDLRYKKALTFNRDFKLDVCVRKSDRFGESARAKEEKQVKEENDKDFIAAIEKADKANEMAVATEPNNNGVEILKKALSFGITSFKIDFFKDNEIEIKEVGKKDGVSYFYCVGVDSFLSVE